MTFSVTLSKRLSLTTGPDSQPESTRLIMEVTAVQGFADLGIFLDVINQVTGQPEYAGVVSSTDLQNYTFQQAGGQDFVRVASIDQTYESATVAEAAAASIEAAIQQLCDDQQALSDLGQAVVLTISSS